MVPVLAGISLVLFTILALAPGDPFEELAANPNVPREVAQALRHQYGLDDPVAVRYVRWFSAMLKGDWGFSFVSRVNVDTLIMQRLPTSLFVLGSAQLLGLLIALPIGTYSALRPYSLFDQVATTLAFIGFSLPTFFTGLVFILVFSLWLDWLPFIYRADIAATGWRWWWEHARQAAMPVAVLGLFQGATLTRFVRSAVLDVVRLDYVNTARAKGLSERVTVVKHVVRNALIPVVTLVALQIPGIFTGAVITEQIFRIPGIGSLLISSILANDTLLVMVAAVLVGPFVYRVPIDEIDFKAKLKGPSRAHPLGTDDLGQDLLARMLYGGRISLAVGVVAMLISITIGTSVGALAGQLGGAGDHTLMRITDLFLSLPQLPLLLLVVYLFRDMLKKMLGPEAGVFILIVAVICGLRWMPVARLVRAQFLSLREKEFVEAARSLGASPLRQVVWHILPNALGPVIVAGSLDVAVAIIAESSLSFLGLGFPPDIPPWGRILFDAKDNLDFAPHWALFPGTAIFLTVLSINYIGDGLRDALDPRKVLGGK